MQTRPVRRNLVVLLREAKECARRSTVAGIRSGPQKSKIRRRHGIQIGAVWPTQSFLERIYNRIMSERRGSQERFLLVVLAILVAATVVRWILRLIGRLR